MNQLTDLRFDANKASVVFGDLAVFAQERDQAFLPLPA